ncbi:MAG: phenylalanine--tRNA ligase subunit beta [Methanobrevibacter sp.]|jgi:phenylalanyl-tRNA synthetase beta chain|nr:phenylalanine--tRNA ligase subunit beta [Candidatus Methanoflexus mossambicus]
MPVINFKYENLEELGISIEKEKLINILPMLGSDIEDYNDEEIKVEFFPNRPDQLSLPGLSRSFKGFLSQETGFPYYEIKKSGEKVIVDDEILKIRPYIAFAIIKNVDFSGDKLKQIMDFQENLHWVIGRDRKKVAIGIHNLDVIKGDYKYIAGDKNKNRFIPLEHEDKMTLEEILTKHDKGSKYSHLIKDFDYYPLILDSEDNVLSMPPIINGELTKLQENTQNILVDVTGTDENAVNNTLNIISSSFGEVGGKIESLEIVYPNKTITTPNLNPKEKIVHVDIANKLIGINIDVNEANRLISKARMEGEIIDNNTIKVKIPSYRIDILHEVDLVENIAIQYCINKIESKVPEIATIANEHPWFKSNKPLREVLIGLGFQEIMSLMLTNEENHYTKMKQEININNNENIKNDSKNNKKNNRQNNSKNNNKNNVDYVEVARPISVERTMIRTSLINGLLEFLEDNKHEDLPQKIFEIGDVLFLDENEETKTKMRKKIAGAICHSNSNFTEIKSTVASILDNLGYNWTITESNNTSFIPGRVANIDGNSKNSNITGVFGEISPEVLINFELEYPVTIFEIEFQ